MMAAFVLQFCTSCGLTFASSPFDLVGEPDHNFVARVADFVADVQTAIGASALAIEIRQGSGFVDADFCGHFLTGWEDGKVVPQTDKAVAQGFNMFRYIYHK
jgi:hypothetical protein